MTVEQDGRSAGLSAVPSPFVSRGGLIAVLVVAALLIVAWLVGAPGRVEPRVVEGWAQPNADGTAIGLFERPG